MKIGVVLCTYNGERYLQEQMDSILAQDRLPDVMLVQDDGSKDRTMSILESCAARAPFAFDIQRNAANLGFVHNFEQAIARCSADIIVLSDQDDYWRRDKLEKIEQSFASDPRAAVVFSDAEIVDEALAPLGYGLLHALNMTGRERDWARSGDFLPILLRRNIVAGATMAIRGDRKHRYLPIPEGSYHDEWIALMAAAFNEMRYHPEPLIQYRQHASNQLGGRRLNVAERLRRLLRPRHKEDLRRLQVVNSLHDRIDGLGLSAAVVLEVKGKRHHLQTRTSLPSSRLLRVPPVVRELLSGRYERYSSGWRGAVRDLVSS